MEILVCTGRVCTRKGSGVVEGILRQALPEHKVFPSGCLGVCRQAPVILHDGGAEFSVTPEKCEELIAEYRNGTEGTAV